MAVFNQCAGDAFLGTVPQNAVVIFVPVVEPCLNASGVQPNICKFFHLYLGKGKTFGIIFPLGRNPHFGAEQGMLL